MLGLFSVAQGYKNALAAERKRVERQAKRRERMKAQYTRLVASNINERERELLNALHDHAQACEVTPQSKPCPECGSGTSIADVGGVELDICCRCGGIWFDDGELAELTGESTDRPSTRVVCRQSTLNCSACHKPMRECPYSKKSNLLIDECVRCGIKFLHKGELERIFKLR